MYQIFIANCFQLHSWVEIHKTKGDECVISGQNVFLGPTTHLPRLGCLPKSHHLCLNHEMCHSSRMRFHKKQ